MSTAPRGQRQEQLLAVLAMAPDRAFRPRDLAAATGLTGHEASTSLYYLWTRGRVQRHYNETTRRSVYQANA